jgi:hypothetical protein
MEREKRGQGRWQFHCPRCGPTVEERAARIRALPQLDVLCPPCEVQLGDGRVGLLLAKLPGVEKMLVEIEGRQEKVAWSDVKRKAA